VAAGLLGGVVASVLLWRAGRKQGETPTPVVANPAEMRVSLGFGALYAAVLVLAAWLSHELGSTGLYGVALVSGLTDVDAITLSTLRLHDLGQIGPSNAVTAITLALLANIAFKFGLVASVAGLPTARKCLVPMGGAAAGLVLGLVVIS
jgi:uncharacterized membrane protein (DUF4010 family)